MQILLIIVHVEKIGVESAFVNLYTTYKISIPLLMLKVMTMVLVKLQ